MQYYAGSVWHTDNCFLKWAVFLPSFRSCLCRFLGWRWRCVGLRFGGGKERPPLSSLAMDYTSIPSDRPRTHIAQRRRDEHCRRRLGLYIGSTVQVRTRQSNTMTMKSHHPTTLLETQSPTPHDNTLQHHPLSPPLPSPSLRPIHTLPSPTLAFAINPSAHVHCTHTHTHTALRQRVSCRRRERPGHVMRLSRRRLPSTEERGQKARWAPYLRSPAIITASTHGCV